MTNMTLGRCSLAILAALACALAGPASVAEPPLTGPQQTYMPRLGDIMGATQLRHFKLWYAGSERNWALAGYELEQIKDSFQDAMVLYPGLAEADMRIMAKPADAVDAAIKAKDRDKFVHAFGDMTAACNDCHRSQGYGFIAIKVPTASPFSNESFVPQGSGKP